jgi:hypothetical protein
LTNQKKNQKIFQVGTAVAWSAVKVKSRQKKKNGKKKKAKLTDEK